MGKMVCCFILSSAFILCSTKILLVTTVSAEEITKTIQVKYFFPRDGKQNPDGSKGIPNWFYYWGQITGKGDLAYGGSHARRFGCYDYNGKEGHLDKCIIYDKVIQKDNDTGPKGKAGIDCFGQTVLHERKHREQFHNSGYPDTNGDGIPDWTHTMDQDLDWLSDSYERKHGFNPKNPDTDGDGVLDREEEAIQAEFGWPNNSRKDQDWAYPGQNWP